MTKNYEVRKMSFDAARPWAVVATFRSFNQVMGRYADKASARNRARDLNRRSQVRAKLAEDSEIRKQIAADLASVGL